MDWILFLKSAGIGLAPVMPLIFATVAYLKKAGLKGNSLTHASLISGVFFGALAVLVQVRPPAGDWFVLFQYCAGVLVYGLIAGFTVSGVYDGSVNQIKNRTR